MVKCEKQCPDEIRCRRVLRCSTTCEVVPVTKYHCEMVEDEVPYTVCRKVQVKVCKQVPVKVTRIEQDICTRQVPVTVRRMVPETTTRQVVINTKRKVRGAYVDEAGEGHACAAPNRSFVEGACWRKTLTCVNQRMVRETICKEIPCTTMTTVRETRVKQVPYTVCNMVPQTRTKMVSCKVTDMVCEKKIQRVPYTVTSMVPCSVTRQVKEKVTEMVPYTVCVQVPVTYCEQIPCTVTKRVPVCVERDVCVRKLRLDPVCNDPCLKGFIGRLQPLDSVMKGGNHQAPSTQAPSSGLSFNQAP